MQNDIFLPAPAQSLCQGDIFESVRVTDPAAVSPDEPELSTRVVLLTNDCDIDKKSHRSLAVIRLTDISVLETANAGLVGDIRADRSPAAWHIPAAGSLPESFVDFRFIYRVRKTELVALTDRRLLSMTEPGRKILGIRVHTYFRRQQDPRKPGQRAPKVHIVDPEAR
jgi:hypothetical protein